MLEQIKVAWRRYYLQEKGGVAVEFSIVFIPFIISILFIAEMCRVAYLSATLDLLLAESGYIASVSYSVDDYQKYFSKEMTTRIKQRPLFSRGVKVNLSILYCDSISAMTSTTGSGCSYDNPENKTLAMYRISIDYRPLFFIFPHNMATRELNRRIALVQEFQSAANKE